MIPIVRPAVVALVMLAVTGCQTASLEDAAPKIATLDTFDTAAGAPVPAAADAPAGSVEAPMATADATPAAPESAPASGSTVIRRNPGFTSIIPIEKTTPVVSKDFVTAGTVRSGRYPKFGEQPKAANSQFSDADKVAAEAEMAELLRNRAATPDARKQYEARLMELRALAATHASDTQQEIEN